MLSRIATGFSEKNVTIPPLRSSRTKLRSPYLTLRQKCFGTSLFYVQYTAWNPWRKKNLCIRHNGPELIHNHLYNSSRCYVNGYGTKCFLYWLVLCSCALLRWFFFGKMTWHNVSRVQHRTETNCNNFSQWWMDACMRIRSLMCHNNLWLVNLCDMHAWGDLGNTQSWIPQALKNPTHIWVKMGIVWQVITVSWMQNFELAFPQIARSCNHCSRSRSGKHPDDKWVPCSNELQTWPGACHEMTIQLVCCLLFLLQNNKCGPLFNKSDCIGQVLRHKSSQSFLLKHTLD